jgi:hypothetical protein
MYKFNYLSGQENGSVTIYYNIMDEEVFEKAKDEDLDKDGAEELQEIVDETGLDVDEAFEILEEGGL